MRCYICDNIIDNPTWDEQGKCKPCSSCSTVINEVKGDYFIDDLMFVDDDEEWDDD